MGDAGSRLSCDDAKSAEGKNPRRDQSHFQLTIRRESCRSIQQSMIRTGSWDNAIVQRAAEAEDYAQPHGAKMKRLSVPLRAPVSFVNWDLECENSRYENYGRPHFPRTSAHMPVVRRGPGDSPWLRQAASLGGRVFQKPTRWQTSPEVDCLDIKLNRSPVADRRENYIWMARLTAGWSQSS
jgi:hypothetical protein